MFKSLRLRLTLWFVCLSSAAYLVTTVTTGVLFHEQLTGAIDDELTELLAESLASIDYENKTLNFTTGANSPYTKPIRRLASIQLFDQKAQLLHETGAPGLARLLDRNAELRVGNHSLRGKSRKLFVKGNFVGYLQVQLPTYQREHAESERLMMLLLTAPVLLLLLAGSGYYFTTLTTRPIEEAFSILRDFMTNVGHELNTPLSSAQAVLDNLGRNSPPPGELPKKLATINLSLTRMRNLVDDMMMLAKLDSERLLKRELEALELHELLTATVELMQPLFEEQHISLAYSSIANARIYGNKSQIEQLITNLVANAIYYNKDEGMVSIDLRVSANKAVLCISDTGIGISEQDIPKIFDRFFRVENSRSRETGGSGLGLSIVKSVVESHGGSISVESQIAKGTRITVTFPLA